MHAKYEVSISYGWKGIVHYGSGGNVKVENRQTDKQADKNNIPPIIWSGGIKNTARQNRNTFPFEFSALRKI